MKRVVAFDLDGTLVDSAHHLLPAYRRAFLQTGLPMPEDRVFLSGIGGTSHDIHQLLMPECTIEKYRVYAHNVMDYCLEEAKKTGRAYPNVKESLIKLREDGYTLVLCSNGNAEHYSRPLLETLGILPFLDHIQPISGMKDKSELLASIIQDFDCKGYTVMVGDRHFDARAAKDNQVPFIGCLYGLFPEEIYDARPQAILHHASELPEEVNNLFKKI